MITCICSPEVFTLGSAVSSRYGEKYIMVKIAHFQGGGRILYMLFADEYVVNAHPPLPLHSKVFRLWALDTYSMVCG